MVYCGSGDKCLHALDAGAGQERWNFRTDSFVTAGAAVARGVVYCGSQDGSLYALDAETGSERWRFKTPGGIWGAPSVAGRTLYFGSGDRYLHALDVETGQELWKYETGAFPVYCSPVIAAGTVYFGHLSCRASAKPGALIGLR